MHRGAAGDPTPDQGDLRVGILSLRWDGEQFWLQRADPLVEIPDRLLANAMEADNPNLRVEAGIAWFHTAQGDIGYELFRYDDLAEVWTCRRVGNDDDAI